MTKDSWSFDSFCTVLSFGLNCATRQQYTLVNIKSEHFNGKLVILLRYKVTHSYEHTPTYMQNLYSYFIGVKSDVTNHNINKDSTETCLGFQLQFVKNLRFHHISSEWKYMMVVCVEDIEVPIMSVWSEGIWCCLCLRILWCRPGQHRPWWLLSLIALTD